MRASPPPQLAATPQRSSGLLRAAYLTNKGRQKLSSKAKSTKGQRRLALWVGKRRVPPRMRAARKRDGSERSDELERRRRGPEADR